MRDRFVEVHALEGAHPGVKNEVLSLKFGLRSLEKESLDFSSESRNSIDGLKTGFRALSDVVCGKCFPLFTQSPHLFWSDIICLSLACAAIDMIVEIRISFWMQRVCTEELDSIHGILSTTVKNIAEKQRSQGVRIEIIEEALRELRSEADAREKFATKAQETSDAKLKALDAENSLLKREVERLSKQVASLMTIPAWQNSSTIRLDDISALTNGTAKHVQTLEAATQLTRSKLSQMQEDYGAAFNAVAKELRSMRSKVETVLPRIEVDVAERCSQLETKLASERSREQRRKEYQLKSLEQTVKSASERMSKQLQRDKENTSKLQSFVDATTKRTDESMARSLGEIRAVENHMRTSMDAMRRENVTQMDTLSRKVSALQQAVRSIAPTPPAKHHNNN